MYNYLKINAAFVFVCLVFGGITLASKPNDPNLTISEPNDPNLYKPIAKVPSGFYLANTIVVKSVKDEIHRFEWSLAKNKKDLVVKKTEKTSIKKGEKYADSIRETWYKVKDPNTKSKDIIKVFKLVFPDKETLDKCVDLELNQYSITPEEIKQPAIGDKEWKYETQQTTLLECCKGLIFIRIDISSRSLSAAERLKLAEDIIKANLPAQKNVSNLLENNNNQTKNLSGSWIKEKTQQEGSEYPGDKDWKLIVTFNDNGRFIWDSKRKESTGKIIDESLTGTYTIEKGFMISYQFDKPSNQALEKLPKLFAFWPNKLLGQQTFRFEDNYLILGYDGSKTWFYLKRKVP
jgi:hypothetical protein